jgi:hypothetical protein
MDDKLKRIHDKLNNDLKYFCKYAPLKIRTKDSTTETLHLNKAQRYVHDKLEKQLKHQGKVRAFIVKGRQQGISTYIAARFYHKTTRNKSKSAFILAHDADTTDKLFKLTKRYHDNIDEANRPNTAYSNRKELMFDRLDSDYRVGTAGSKSVGRGGTPHLFHGSEVAFWENADEIKRGLIQSIPDANGTEIIYESTANGMDEMFYKGIMGVREGDSEYQVIFVPWYWQDEYRKQPTPNFNPTEDEIQLAELYNLDNEQLMFRRLKITDLGSEHAFKQEYPCNIDEAFIASGDALIKTENVIKARMSHLKAPNSPLIMGVDPARDGDRTAIAFRRGREFPAVYTKENMDQMLLAGLIAQLIDKHNPVKCFIDVAHGYGCIDRLNELGYRSIVQGVHFGERALEPDLYFNKRVEMWMNLRDWFNDEVNIPDKDEIQKDLLVMPDYLQTSSGKYKLVAKDEIRKKLGASPDIGDAMALTFAYPVNSAHNSLELKNKSKGLTTLKRKRK